MRTGAIFARGSCRALKWMALVGVVFTLGVGSAAAQIVLPGDGTTTTVSPDKVTLQENGSSMAVRVMVRVPAGTAEAAAGSPHTVALEIPEDTDVRWTNTEDTTAPVTSAFTDAGRTLTYSFVWAQNDDDAQEFSALARLRAVDDEDTADDDVDITVTVGANTDTLDVTVKDNDEQEYELVGPSDNKLDEGESLTLQLMAKKPFADEEVVRLRVALGSANDDSDYNFSGSNGTTEDFTLQGDTAEGAGDAITSVDVTLVSEPNDVDRVDDTITLTVTYAADAGDNDRGDMAVDPSLELMVIDQHKLPSVEIASDGITVKKGTPEKDTPVETLTEGETGTVTLVADRGTNTDEVPDGEDIEVKVTAMAGSTADSADYDLRGSPVEIEAAAGKGGTGSFTLEVEVDQDVGPEVLMLMATVSGDDMYGTDTRVVELGSISFVDDTTKKIEPRTADEVHAAIDEARMEGAGDNGRWTAGETMTLMASELFDWPETTTSVVLGNSISEDQQIATATTSNDSLMITAVSGGMTEISVTATVVSEASGFLPTQTISSAATVKFPITVDAEAITVMSQVDVNAAVVAAIKKAADMASSGQWEPGGATAMVALSDLFDVPDSISAIYDAASSDMGDVEAGISSDKMYVTLIPISAGTATIRVTAADTASGGATATVSFDATVMAQAAIVGKSQAEVDAVFMTAGAGMLVAGGPAVMVPANELFTIAPGAEPTYSVDSEMVTVLKASASGTMVELMPMAAGSSMIMVTAVDNASRSIADVTYKASVKASAITYTIEGPENKNLVEGMDHANGTKASGMVKVMASRPLEGDETAEVKLMRDGGSSATMDDFEVMPEMVMLKAGAAEAVFTVKAIEDNMPDAGTNDNQAEMLTLFAVVDGMQMSDQAVMFYIWDMAVPALPIIAQLLLGGLLAFGGFRRYRRRS